MWKFALGLVGGIAATLAFLRLLARDDDRIDVLDRKPSTPGGRRG